MTLRRALVVTAVILVGVRAPVASADGAAPTAQASVQAAPLGQVVRVTGAGWQAAAGESVVVVVCGNDALDGAADCQLDATAAAAVEPDGTFVTLVTVVQPPSPCPCVLRVTAPTTDYDIDLPLMIEGVPRAAPSPKYLNLRSVALTQVHLEGSGSFVDWILGGAHRTLVYTVTNTGKVVLSGPTVGIVVGRGQNPTGYVQAPTIGDLGIGQSESFSVPVVIPALSLGTYRAIVRVDPLGPVATASSSTFAFPWVALTVLAVGLVLLGVALGRWRRRRRARPRPLSLPGWYLDPLGEGEVRLWDGAAWTSQVRSIDSLSDAELLSQEPGWYADPTCAGRLRLWNGGGWTGDTRQPDPVTPTPGAPVAAHGEGEREE